MGVSLRNMCGSLLSTLAPPVGVCASLGTKTLKQDSEEMEEKRKEEQLRNEDTTLCTESKQNFKEPKFTNHTKLPCIETRLETSPVADLPNIPKSKRRLRQTEVSISTQEGEIGKHRQELSEWRETEIRLKAWLGTLKRDYRQERGRLNSLVVKCEELEHEVRSLKRKRALCDTIIHELACSKKKAKRE